ncbi:hypothetical protein V498_03592 [Pseudogymnoascus sp. VKM F-4517 (FW-2822)]|nr:hypothetical protein V498_03592 [Pseudogymnoascus sp. VKM F-4517 (FW-2822)]
MDSTTPVVAPGQSPPLTVISPTDQGGVVLIITALGMVFALVSILIRLYIRLQIRHTYERDDTAVAIAMVFSIVQSSVVFVEVSKGYGKTIGDISATGIIELQKASYASDLLYIVTLWFTKFSVALLLSRLSSDKRHNWMSRVILLTAAIFATISIFIVALRCDISRPWIFINEQCSNLFVRWQVVLAFDIITELALVGSSVYLVQDLQVPLGKKIVVVLAFALRLPIIAPAALRLYYLNIEFSSSDPTLSGVLASVCAQVETSYAIISATIPCLRPFMSSLNTHYGAPAKPKSSTGTGSGGSNPLTPLESLTKAGRSLGTKMGESRGEMWDKPGNLTRVTRGEKHSIDSHDSKQMIITKDTEFRVEFERQSGMQTPRTADRPVADV